MTLKDLFASQNIKKKLLDDTLFYPGHEYTMHGMAFAVHNAPHNPELRRYVAEAQVRLGRGLPAGPVSIGLEKRCNPYLKAQTLDELEQLLGQ